MATKRGAKAQSTAHKKPRLKAPPRERGAVRARAEQTAQEHRREIDQADLLVVARELLQLVGCYPRGEGLFGHVDLDACAADYRDLHALVRLTRKRRDAKDARRARARAGKLVPLVENWCDRFSKGKTPADVEGEARNVLAAVDLDPDEVVGGGFLAREEQLSVESSYTQRGVIVETMEQTGAWTAADHRKMREAAARHGLIFPDRVVDKFRLDLFPLVVEKQGRPAMLAARVFGRGPRSVTDYKKADVLMAMTEAFGATFRAEGMVALALACAGVPKVEAFDAAVETCGNLRERKLLTSNGVEPDEVWEWVPPRWDASSALPSLGRDDDDDER